MPVTRNLKLSVNLPPPIVGYWLILCCILVLLMVIIGGLTRLTESGLSIVDWRPLTGIFPPTSHAEWQILFEAYRFSPEFNKLNFWMTLEDFKSIFWLEYFHRLWGRIIGIVFFIPFLWFLCRRMIPKTLAWQLLGLFGLGGLQGVLGWYMVQSGLIDQPTVSQYRLAAHLILATLIYVWLFWLALTCLKTRPIRNCSEIIRGFSFLVIVGTFITMVWGALVAGLDAGLAFNTFPLMNGKWIPQDLFTMSPWWINFFENTATVQFFHRKLGVALVLLIIIFCVFAIKTPLPNSTRILIFCLTFFSIGQMALGITTLLMKVAYIPAIFHQAGALAIITLAVLIRYDLGVTKYTGKDWITKGP